jgi:DNA-binding NtrC family response regulator
MMDINCQIMVVDDDDLVLDVLSKHLSNSGFQPVLASSANEALKILDQVPLRAIVSDLYMGEGPEGLTLLEGIRRSNQAIPVIIMSGTATASVMEDVIRKGAYAFIPKPFEISALLSLIADATHMIDNREQTT